MSPRKRKIRVQFRKNRGKRTRADHTWKESIRQGQEDQLASNERISGKGELSRHRTVIAEETETGELIAALDVDEAACLRGRVVSIVGSHQCRVQADDGRLYSCVVRKVLRTLSQDVRNPIVAGDLVLFEPQGEDQGIIQRIEPRQGVLGRGTDRQWQLLVSNVDRAVIVVTPVAPHFKLSLIDRFLIGCHQGGVKPIICINKCDLVQISEILPAAGLYANLGYDVVLTSALNGYGLNQLRQFIQGTASVFSGQSGVGKSSLLNAIQPGLSLKTAQVAQDSGKGRHTTRTALLQPLEFGGWVVDTPGIRKMRLWDVPAEHVEGYFLEFRPFVRYCRFPNCRHVHEQDCGIKSAVQSGLIARPRYESYLRILSDDED